VRCAEGQISMKGQIYCSALLEERN